MTSLPDYSNQDLRGRSFRDADLDGADFTGADLRGADFSNSSLIKADFTDARFGIRRIASVILLGAAMVVSALAGLSIAFFMQSLRESLYLGTDWQDGLASIIMLLVIATFLVILVMKGAHTALPSLGVLIVVAFLVDFTIVLFLGQIRLERAPYLITLLVLTGLAFVAGILGRIVAGTFGAWAIALMGIVGGLVAGSVSGGLAAALVASLLVVMSKRTLKGDNRDRLLRDVSHRIVTRHGTRFTNANLSGATFTGTNLVAADMTGTLVAGTVWGPGQIPHRLDPQALTDTDEASAAAVAVDPDAQYAELVESAPGDVEHMFAQTASGMSFAPDGRITLHGVSGATLWVSDRPHKLVGHTPTVEFVSQWEQRSYNFAENPPTAFLSTFGDNANDVVLVLTDPQLRGSNLSYAIEISGGDLMPSDGPVSLFIDMSGRPVTPMSVAGVHRRGRRRV